MNDPFLDAHWRQTRIYSLSDVTPISIRDQMIRGYMMASRLTGRYKFSQSHPLLVIGAGVAGSTLAIAAVSKGIPTCLIERDSRPFNAQRYARSRTIDPTQYDWPADHYVFGKFQWGRYRAMPLHFLARSADKLSMIWERRLRSESRLNPNLTVMLNTSLNSAVVSPDEKFISVELSTGEYLDPSVVVYTYGAGDEDCRLKDSLGNLQYEGQRFWEPDEFQNLGTEDRVLISGSGDGALQDYIRVLTGLHRPVTLIRRLLLPDDLIHALQSAEDRAHRGRSWVNDDPSWSEAQEAPYLKELDYVHAKMAARALSVYSVRNALDSSIKRDVDCNLSYRGKYLSCYYGLNRFLTHLIAKYIQDEYGKITLHPNETIESVVPARPVGHACVVGGRASGHTVGDVLLSHACFREWHDVSFESGKIPPGGRYNVVIIRHGIDRMAHPLPLLPLPSRPKHLLPYHLP